MKVLIISGVISVGLVLAITLSVCLPINYNNPTLGIQFFIQDQLERQRVLTGAVTLDTIILIVAFSMFFSGDTLSWHSSAPGNYNVAKSESNLGTIRFVAIGNMIAAFVTSLISGKDATEIIIHIVAAPLITIKAVTEGGIPDTAFALFIFLFLVFLIFWATAIPCEICYGGRGAYSYPISTHPKDKKPIFDIGSSIGGLLTGLITFLINFGILYGLPELLI